MLRPYELRELTFAYCYRVYLRWRTHKNQARPELARLDQPTLDQITQPYGIRVLEANCDEKNVLVLASLEPGESVSGCAGKLKGQTSKWLREALALEAPANLVSKGYFACSVGKSNAKAVEDYLSKQPSHHGYEGRAHPPVFVREYRLTDSEEARFHPKHARAIIQLHVVLATLGRAGVFGAETGEALAEHWTRLGEQNKFGFVKVSFVPDHAHLAMRVHPTVSPAGMVLGLMSSAQEFMFENYREELLRAKVNRLWEPSAYFGSYGSLEAPKVAKYIQDWESEAE